MARELSVRDAAPKGLNEGLKNQHNFTLQVVKTVAEFAQQLATIHEQQAEELQGLVDTFRKRNAELRRERPLQQSNLFYSWENFLQEVEVDSQMHSDIASCLGRQVSVPLLERTFHRKVQSRKLFTHRESYEAILNRTEELLSKCHKDYCQASQKAVSDQSDANKASYYNCHNTYVQQLHAANAMTDEYNSSVLPQLLEELEEVYLDLSSTLSKSISDSADIIASKGIDQHERYDKLGVLSKSTVGRADMANYVRTLGVDKVFVDNNLHVFTPPQLEINESEIGEVHFVPTMKDEVLVDRTTLPSMRATYDALRKEAADLEGKIRQLQEAIDSLLRLQQRSLESNLFNKASELQEDISLKRFDLRVMQIHLAAVRAQVAVIAPKVADRAEGDDRKMSSASTGSIKSKWLRAFKSLKSGSDGGSSKKKDSVSSRGDLAPPTIVEGVHFFQPYTYKKISACDVCKEIFRGHTRQGLHCKMCKANVHAECQAGAGKCQPKSRLLRRQRSTSEIETTGQEKTERVDPIYQLLKQAGDLGGKRVPPESPGLLTQKQRATSSLAVMPLVPPASMSAPHSPQRQKLSLRMKSLSLDSPESNEHRTRHQSPPSPVRRLLAAKAVRMSSVDLPDENEKSFSSASTSPCPSPKPHRLLPTNLYVVVYDFRARQADEVDLKAGETVTVMDTSDADWWKGKCLGRGGLFPSKYVVKLNPGERPLQVTHNLQVSDGDNALKLARDQIVIQMGEEQDGLVLVRSGDRQGLCPLRYLQEV